MLRGLRINGVSPANKYLDRACGKNLLHSPRDKATTTQPLPLPRARLRLLAGPNHRLHNNAPPVQSFPSRRPTLSAMARPCNVVDPEEHYQRLERLLTELYLVLRTLIYQGGTLLPPPSFNFHPPPPPPPSEGRPRNPPSRRGGCEERMRSRRDREDDDQQQSGGNNNNNTRQRTICEDDVRDCDEGYADDASDGRNFVIQNNRRNNQPHRAVLNDLSSAILQSLSIAEDESHLASVT
ncbi:Hypothetical predicted protein [Cloeon dipterum]|uniref:Uncharacterized protein n=1 Tax=Cloeon dipterum TaxID=197152 RepID=A0A8S1DRT3_9INSE|nr:Hypothetical predicted protein [Cloeon dipterum]